MAFKNKEIISFVKDYCDDDTIGLIVVKNRNDGNVQSHLKQCIDDNSIVFNLHEVSWTLAAMSYNAGVAGAESKNKLFWDDLDEETQKKYHDIIKQSSVNIFNIGYDSNN